MMNIDQTGGAMNRIRELAQKYFYIINFVVGFLTSFLISGLYFSMSEDDYEPVALEAPGQSIRVPPQSEIIYVPDYHGTPCFTVSCIGAPGPAN